MSQSTAMVMSGWSVYQNKLFPGQANQYFVHITSLVTDNNPSLISERDENGRRDDFMINLCDVTKT